MSVRVLLFGDMIEREMPNKRFSFAKAQMTSFQKNARFNTPCKFSEVLKVLKRNAYDDTLTMR